MVGVMKLAIFWAVLVGLAGAYIIVQMVWALERM